MVVQAARRAAGRTSPQACDVLAAWDGRADLGSRGEVLWREFGTTGRARIPWTSRSTRPLRSHAARAQRLRPGRSRRARERGRRPARPRASRSTCRSATLQAEPRGRRAIRVPGCADQRGLLQRDLDQPRHDRALRPVHGLVVHHGRRLRGQGPPARLLGPVLLAVGEPGLDVLRRPDEAVLAEQWLPMRFTQKHIKADPAYSKRVVTGSGEGGGVPVAVALVVVAVSSLQFGAAFAVDAVRRARARRARRCSGSASPRSCCSRLAPAARRARARRPAAAVAFGVALGTMNWASTRRSTGSRSASR